ncbi:PKD domain-containing protein [Truepera radiovictrix]|uniref:PKD domain containing protein n=1 Tax=Truepera radiovictrix (strain DSM 17093 / CIP 108686 / LMG 22925 / RQ-24) TaxID=649638 RepID=D7CV90_TRURR|nr:PKD domain-containing protein [Truepera radiovictrix]ADI14118.1 PKD domain containing protein [Truepera radiovictrix DSM 17093]WMT57321.1 PKD domain-containing protein [Truepera radiovictrix]
MVRPRDTSRAHGARRAPESAARGRYILGAAIATALLGACQRTPPPEPEPINLRPEVNLVALPDIGPAPLEVELRANATDPEGAPLTYLWVIEGRSFTGGPVERHTFENPGEYLVEVTVSDGELDAFDEVTVIVEEDGL